jgi:REP element-mobilizing transposase RayT
VGALVGGFKASTTRRINIVRGPPSPPIWQRNYYEHVIRNESELARIERYILENPLRWDRDAENPDRIAQAMDHPVWLE